MATSVLRWGSVAAAAANAPVCRRGTTQTCAATVSTAAPRSSAALGARQPARLAGSVGRQQVSRGQPLRAATPRAVEWKDQFMALSEAKVKSILPEEAMRMVTAGEAVLVDVRKAEDYNTSHALDAVSVPLFQAVNPLKTDMKGMLKFAVYAINGVGAVEPNLNFEDEVAALVGDKAVIMYCEAGGMLEPTPNFMYGRESRSLKACYKALMDERMSTVYHLSGGLFKWYKDGFETTGEYDASNVGRTPNSAAVAVYPEKK
mmetsp:Transcript_38557/g.98602  ORF Transcript_38557/g.98602 Transcript_38557/m.98602 type:complete len:260 (-) Transcript_38557:52-831(-)